MRTPVSILRKAKALAALSLDAHQTVQHERVQAILKAIEGFPYPPAKLRLLLKHYARYVTAALRQTEGTVEYAGKVAPEAIEALSAHLKNKTGREIKLATSENLDLIAGIRLSFADHVWENSVAHNLSFLNKI
jgi:hypothetical protein